MKRILIATSLFLTSSYLWAAGGSLTITAPATASVGGSSPQWQYNQSGTLAGVAPVTINAGAITLSSTHTIILASATASSSTYTLPAASNTGQILQITKVDLSTRAVAIVANGTDLIAGSTRTLTLNALGQTDEIVADGTGWWPHGQGIQMTPNFIANGVEGPNSSVMTVSSAVVVCPVNIPVPVAVTAFRYVASSGNGGNVSFVLYDRYGYIVASTGPFAIGGFGVNTSTITPVNVSPGIYYLGAIDNFSTSSFYSAWVNTTGSGCSINTGSSITLPNPFVFGTPTTSILPLVHLIVAGGRTP